MRRNTPIPPLLGKFSGEGVLRHVSQLVHILLPGSEFLLLFGFLPSRPLFSVFLLYSSSAHLYQNSICGSSQSDSSRHHFPTELSEPGLSLRGTPASLPAGPKVAQPPVCNALSRLLLCHSWNLREQIWSEIALRGQKRAGFPTLLCFIYSVPSVVLFQRAISAARTSRYWRISMAPPRTVSTTPVASPMVRFDARLAKRADTRLVIVARTAGSPTSPERWRDESGYD